MRFITGLALRRRSVTVLAVILVLAAGMFTYRTLPVELFPEIEFPLVTVAAFYPSANPDAVVRDVTAPIENVIAGVDGLDSMQSISSENRSIILASFEFGTDMAAAESEIRSSVNALTFPEGVFDPVVSRITPDSFPVIQLSVIGNRDLVEIQRLTESLILPELSGIDGVYSVEVTGDVQQRVLITADPQRMAANGVSLFQISGALRENNVTLPGGAVSNGVTALPIKTTGEIESLDELRGLVVGFKRDGGPLPAGMPPGVAEPVILADIADVGYGPAPATSISRTNGKRSLSVNVVKEPDANSVDVTTAVVVALDDIQGMPADVEVIVVSNDGPAIQEQITTLEREAILGLTLAVMVVFACFITLRPTAIRGVLNTLRPTVVIGLSIPLSIMAGVLLISWQGLSLNFMTLGGLAISVGRVVDDSIVVLENVYRNIQGGRDRWRAALDATVEVGPAITASTLTTIVVFVPLGFIQGLVGAFFFPFALTVSFALIASLAVALTAVPVLGAYLLRPGDLASDVGEVGDDEELPETETWMQRAYTPVLRWALAHKAITLVAALVIVLASLSLMRFIPVNLFGSAGDRYLTIDMTLPPGTPVEATLEEATGIERSVADITEVYVTTIGSPDAAFGQGGAAGFNQSNTFLRLSDNAPENSAEDVRAELSGVEGRLINVTEIQQGPPQAGLDVVITGSNYDDIASVAMQLTDSLRELDDVENVVSDVSEARDEVIVSVDPAKAAALGLSAQTVGFQVSQFLVGQTVTQIEVDGEPVDVTLVGASDGVTDVKGLGALTVAGPAGVAPLSDIATIEVVKGPVTISRNNGERSANITGSIVGDDAQAVGNEIQDAIDSIALPPGVNVVNGGVFADIREGFQAIFVAMAVGIVLVYLVMVASLGSLRNPFVIVTSLPLAIIGALVALAITGRSLGLPAMMGILMLIGIVVTNAIVLISFVEQLRERRGLSVYDALIQGGRIRLRPILMTAITTSIALLPLAAFVEDSGGIIGAELATVVIGGLVSSTALTLVVVPIVYTLANESIPALIRRVFLRSAGAPQPEAGV